MKKLKYYITMGCISFTLNIIILLILNYINISGQLNNTFLRDIMLMHFAIIVALYIIDLFTFQSTTVYIGVSILSVIAVVLVLGGLVFSFIELNLYGISIMIAISVVIYALVYLLTYVRNQSDAQIINNKLKDNLRRKDRTDG